MGPSLSPAVLLFAQEAVPRPAPRVPQWEVWLAIGSLMAVLGFGVWAIYRVKRWRQEQAEPVALMPAQQLDDYQKMVDAGLLDPAELAQIKASLQTPPFTPPSTPPPDTSNHKK